MLLHMTLEYLLHRTLRIGQIDERFITLTLRQLHVGIGVSPTPAPGRKAEPVGPLPRPKATTGIWGFLLGRNNGSGADHIACTLTFDSFLWKNMPIRNTETASYVGPHKDGCIQENKHDQDQRLAAYRLFDLIIPKRLYSYRAFS